MESVKAAVNVFFHWECPACGLRDGANLTSPYLPDEGEAVKCECEHEFVVEIPTIKIGEE